MIQKSIVFQVLTSQTLLGYDTFTREICRALLTDKYILEIIWSPACY